MWLFERDQCERTITILWRHSQSCWCKRHFVWRSCCLWSQEHHQHQWVLAVFFFLHRGELMTASLHQQAVGWRPKTAKSQVRISSTLPGYRVGGYFKGAVFPNTGLKEQESDLRRSLRSISRKSEDGVEGLRLLDIFIPYCLHNLSNNISFFLLRFFYDNIII